MESKPSRDTGLQAASDDHIRNCSFNLSSDVLEGIDEVLLQEDIRDMVETPLTIDEDALLEVSEASLLNPEILNAQLPLDNDTTPLTIDEEALLEDSQSTFVNLEFLDQELPPDDSVNLVNLKKFNSILIINE